MPPEDHQTEEVKISLGTVKMIFAVLSGIAAIGTSLSGLFYLKFQVDDNAKQIEKLSARWESNDVVDQNQTKQLAALEPKLDNLTAAVSEVKQLLRDREKKTSTQ